MKSKIIILLSSLIILSCGSEKGTSEIEISSQVISQDLSLTGSYSSCVDTGSSSYLKTEVTVDATTISSRISLYTGSNCNSGRLWTSYKSGTYVIDGTSVTVTNYEGSGTVIAYHIDITIQTFNMTPTNSTIVATWNATSECSLNSWVLDTTKNVLNETDCDPASTGALDEIDGGLVRNLFYTENNNRLVINANISSNGSVTTRPSDLENSTLGTVSLNK